MHNAIGNKKKTNKQIRSKTVLIFPEETLASTLKTHHVLVVHDSEVSIVFQCCTGYNAS